MCGILCEIFFSGCSGTICKDEKILQRIRNRGPNCMQTIEIRLCPDVTVTFCGAVLWMQGPLLKPQPLENEKGILLYNGDIFDETWNSDVCDTQVIMDKLSQEIVEDSTDDNVMNVLKSLKGPFSLIYFDKSTQNLYFSRDKLGRSTLLFYRNDNSIVISSVLGRNYNCVEVPATYVYRLNIKNRKIKQLPWANHQDTDEYSLDTWLENIRLQQSLPDNEFAFHFENEDFCDHDDIVNYVESTAKGTKCKKEVLKQIINHNMIQEVVLNVTELLEKSVRIRLKRQPNKCKDCLLDDTLECNHCTVGVLFSGGLDCTILALLADKYLPKEQSIDLINIAFKKDDKSTYDVPDRLTGKQSYEELTRICPLRKWVFKEVNVPKEELIEFQVTTIADLVYPRQTILDESLGSALWFAARGSDNSTMSPCRVLLLGSGADELFGGYTRHRNAYKRRGWTGLAKELMLDWKRISFRNLSRDNRVICDHGRQPRMPYLDEDFTEYVLQLKPWFKCIPSENLGPGIGDKLMLRLVAYNLGLSEAVILPKKALQFGSRIANNKENGNDKSERFMKCYQ